MNKLQELILYIARCSVDDPRFSAKRLTRLLYLSDFLAFAKFGRSITGEVYQRLEEGPVPRGLATALSVLRGNYAEAERDYCGAKQRRIIALREPDLSLFSGAEIALVDGVIARTRKGAEIDELSDRFPAWEIAEIGEEIPYGTVFVGRPRPLSREEIEHAKRVARDLTCLATETS